MTEVTTVTADPEGRRGDLHVGWIMPPFFHELPVDAEDADEVGERLGELVRTILAEGSEDDQITMFALYFQITAQLAEAGAEYAGFCLMDMDGRRSTATVAVYRMSLEKITAGEALSEAYSALRRAYPDDDVQISTLPSGKGDSQAVVRIGGAPFTITAEASPTGEPLEVPRGQIQVYIPLPNDADMLVFELSTPSMEDWDLYSELFATIVRTLDWATEEEAEMASALSHAQPVPDVAPDPAVVQELYAHSSRVLDALGVRGRMDEGNAVSAVTCVDCWSKGLRSVCTARHHWQIDGVEDAELAVAVGRLEETFQGQGWFKLSGTQGQSVSLAADGDSGHRVNITLISGRQRLVIEVIAPCTRVVRGPVDSAFG
ncbi:hypothetical protein [Streptomyces canus]|uniref:hypothetical protein n=1 Tax=Streptomyces canus TaxID=58343 RepID=UPI00277DD44D|nr:hypothetical protein [Streptomyces canus]MDQ0764333.1 hypothetical protein [Streptomyces canus]MDQ1067225.1 hypothetical protein [Streptomyces canus]